MTIASLSTIAALGVAVSQARMDSSSARLARSTDGPATPPTAPAARAGPSPALRQAEQLGAQLEAELAYQRMALYQFQANLRAMRNGDKPPGQLLDVSA
jgi:hypothetical protein